LDECTENCRMTASAAQDVPVRRYLFTGNRYL